MSPIPPPTSPSTPAQPHPILLIVLVIVAFIIVCSALYLLLQHQARMSRSYGAIRLHSRPNSLDMDRELQDMENGGGASDARPVHIGELDDPWLDQSRLKQWQEFNGDDDEEGEEADEGRLMLP